MTMSDLNPDFEVTGFTEVEHLRPGWSYVRYGPGILPLIGPSGPSLT